MEEFVEVIFDRRQNNRAGSIVMKLDDMKNKIRNLVKSEPYIDQEVNATNIHRLQRFAVILPVVHAASIVIFWPYHVGATDTQEVWRNGIIMLQSVMLLFSILYGIASYFLGLGRPWRLELPISYLS